MFVCRFGCGNLWLDTFKRIGRTFKDFTLLHAGLIFMSPFQGDFDRVTIDQLILLFTSLLLSFRQMELKMVGILLEQSLLISRFVSSTLHDVFFYSAD